MPHQVFSGDGPRAAARMFTHGAHDLSDVHRRISTGKRVSSTRDDPVAFSISQNMRGNVAGLRALTLGLSRAMGVADVAIAASETLSDVLTDMREKALAATDASLDKASRSALTAEFNSLLDEADKIVSSASYRGINLLDGTAPSIDVIADAGLAGRINISGADFAALISALRGGGVPPGPGGGSSPGQGNGPDDNPGRANGRGNGVGPGRGNGGGANRPAADNPVQANEPAGPVTPARSNAASNAPPTQTNTSPASQPAQTGITAETVVAIDDFLLQSSAVTARLGTAVKRLETHFAFLGKVSDAIASGIGSLVDANLSADAAAVQALQVRGQLAQQGIALAASSQSSILQLFAAR